MTNRTFFASLSRSQVALVAIVTLFVTLLAPVAEAMYHPGLGRFLQRDPIGTAISPSSAQRNTIRFGSTDDPSFQYLDGPNLYTNYAPLHGSLDPSGEKEWDIDESACEATLKVWVNFQWVKGNQPPNMGDTWTHVRKRIFRTRFVGETERAWNTGGFVAKPARIFWARPAYGGFGYACGECPCRTWRLKLDVIDGAWRPDYTIEVQANKDFDFVRSSAHIGGPKAFLDEADVIRRRIGAHSQIPAVHEFGHLLGLPHPGQYLTPPATPNSPPDYLADASALMGLGSQMRAVYYDLWKSELDSEYPDCAAHRIE